MFMSSSSSIKPRNVCSKIYVFYKANKSSIFSAKTLVFGYKKACVLSPKSFHSCDSAFFEWFSSADSRFLNSLSSAVFGEYQINSLCSGNWRSVKENRAVEIAWEIGNEILIISIKLDGSKCVWMGVLKCSFNQTSNRNCRHSDGGGDGVCLFPSKLPNLLQFQLFLHINTLCLY